MDVFTPVAPRGTVVGRYALFDKLAASARAEVWLGRLRGQPGARLLTVKRLHRELLCDPIFVSAAVTEARRTSTVEQANLAPFRDVALIEGRELLLVSDYFPGETLAMLFGACFRSRDRMPLPVAIGIVVGILHGLEAAHEARDRTGASLGIVHGGLSPHNVIVGVDGVPRVVDFGFAIARGRAPATTAIYGKGKGAYMSPEQARREPIDRRTDVYAAAVILWELIAGERLFRDTGAADVTLQITSHRIPQLTELHPDLPPSLDEVLRPALARSADARPVSAAALGQALAGIVPPATAEEISDWMRGIARDRLAERAELVAAVADAPDPPEIGAELVPEATVDTTLMPWVVSTPSPPTSQPKRRTTELVLLLGALAAGLQLIVFLRSRPVSAPESLAATAAPPAPPAPAAVAVAPAAPAVPPPARAPAPRPAAPVAAAPRPTRQTPERARPPTNQPAGAAASALAAPERTSQRRAREARARLSASASSPAARRYASQRRTSVPAPRAPDCQPPFTVDAQGIRRIKRECLK